jgi:rhodanese-related sulfurtransferase
MISSWIRKTRCGESCSGRAAQHQFNLLSCHPSVGACNGALPECAQGRSQTKCARNDVEFLSCLGSQCHELPWALRMQEARRNTVVQFQSLRPEEVQELVEGGEWLLVDVRPAEDFEKSTLKGAVNVPLFQRLSWANPTPGTLLRAAAYAVNGVQAVEINPNFEEQMRAVAGDRKVIMVRRLLYWLLYENIHHSSPPIRCLRLQLVAQSECLTVPADTGSSSPACLTAELPAHTLRICAYVRNVRDKVHTTVEVLSLCHNCHCRFCSGHCSLCMQCQPR